MRRTIIYLFVLLIIISNLTSCKPFQDISHYKRSYSDVESVIKQLPESEEFKRMKLHSKNSYGITTVYGNIDNDTIETVIYNATFMFILIENLDWVTFHFPNESYTLKKEQLQKWYGRDLHQFINEKELKNIIENNRKDKEKVKKLFLDL